MEYPKAAVSADIVLFSKDLSKVLLIKRKFDPCKDMFATPGGFINPDETVQEGAIRELKEETGIDKTPQLILSGVYSKPGRDPRGWNISISFTAIIDEEQCHFKAGDDAKEYHWVNIKDIKGMEMAFDHKEIVKDAYHKWGINYEYI